MNWNSRSGGLKVNREKGMHAAKKVFLLFFLLFFFSFSFSFLFFPFFFFFI